MGLQLPSFIERRLLEGGRYTESINLHAGRLF